MPVTEIGRKKPEAVAPDEIKNLCKDPCPCVCPGAGLLLKGKLKRAVSALCRDNSRPILQGQSRPQRSYCFRSYLLLEELDERLDELLVLLLDELLELLLLERFVLLLDLLLVLLLVFLDSLAIFLPTFHR